MLTDGKWKNLTSTEQASSDDYMPIRYGGAMAELRGNFVIYGGVTFDDKEVNLHVQCHFQE